jgi:hypothetical protein
MFLVYSHTLLRGDWAKYGYTITTDELSGVKDEDNLLALVEQVIERQGGYRRL